MQAPVDRNVHADYQFVEHVVHGAVRTLLERTLQMATGSVEGPALAAEREAIGVSVFRWNSRIHNRVRRRGWARRTANRVDCTITVPGPSVHVCAQVG